jgi:hypothetical protein
MRGIEKARSIAPDTAKSRPHAGLPVLRRHQISLLALGSDCRQALLCSHSQPLATQTLQDELFALFKLAWLENARLLARREGQNYYFLASFLSEEEAARFTENFAFP